MSACFLDPRLPDRFWDKVIPEPNSGCWLWTASTKDRAMGFSGISVPLRHCMNAGAVAREKRGRRSFYSLTEHGRSVLGGR